MLCLSGRLVEKKNKKTLGYCSRGQCGSRCRSITSSCCCSPDEKKGCAWRSDKNTIHSQSEISLHQGVHTSRLGIRIANKTCTNQRFWKPGGILPVAFGLLVPLLITIKQQAGLIMWVWKTISCLLVRNFTSSLKTLLTQGVIGETVSPGCCSLNAHKYLPDSILAQGTNGVSFCEMK